MSSFTDLEDRIAELQLRLDKPRLEDVPLAALREWLNENLVPSGNQALLPQSVGPPALEAVPHARVFRDAAHANIAAGTVTAVTFDTEVFDQGGMVNLATNPTRITMPRDGLYYVQGNFYWTVNAANDMAATWINLNGSVAASARIAFEYAYAANAVSGPASNVSTVWRFRAGDYIELRVFADATTTPETSEGHSPVLSACWLSNYHAE